MCEQLDINNCFQLAVARTHTELALMKTTCGLRFVFNGSANLRSSDNLEFVEVEDNEELFLYVKGIHDNIIREYKTINKSIKSKKLWQVVQKN